MIRGFQVSSSGYSLNGLPGIAPGSMVAPEFIDRAELFLGPTGMLSNMPLYGATGGAVNLVTKKANDKPLTALTTGFLSDGQSATHLDVGRRYGLNKEWGIRVNGVYRDGDTAFDNQQEMPRDRRDRLSRQACAHVTRHWLPSPRLGRSDLVPDL